MNRVPLDCAPPGVGLIVACVLAAAHPAAAADPSEYRNLEDFSSEALYATGNVGVGARAMGMAGNYTGIADDVTALLYNPAGLAQLLLVEATLGIHHLEDDNTLSMFADPATANASHTGIDQAAFAYPIPTYRGSLVVGFGVFRARSNDLGESRRDRRSGPDYRFDDTFQRSQRDGVYRYTGGFGIDVARTLSLGASLSYWEGQLRDDQYRRIDEQVTGQAALLYEDRLVTESDVDGFSFDLGLMAYVARGVRLGLTIHSPVWYDLVGSGQFLREATSGTEDVSELLYIDQQPTVPWSFTGGLAAEWGPLLLAGDLRFTDWDEIDLDGDPYAPGTVAPAAPSGYGATLGGGVGAEIAVPRTPLRLRAGYAYDPEPYELVLGNPAELASGRHTWSVGGGLQVAGALVVDAAYVNARFERKDAGFPEVTEERQMDRIYVAATYRR